MVRRICSSVMPRSALTPTSLRFVHAGTNGRTLCDGVFLRAKPSTLTAIVGPTGAEEQSSNLMLGISSLLKEESLWLVMIFTPSGSNCETTLAMFPGQISMIRI